MKKLIQIVNKFKGKRIGVIGDLMLDQFIFGDTERIAPEAPVPVVLVQKEDFAPGGAANTANNIVALGGKVFLVGVVGEDEVATKLINILKRKNINISGIVKCPNRVTTQKVRVVSRGQYIVRFDRENNRFIDRQTEKRLVNFISSKIKDWDAVVIVDYAKGVITKSLSHELVNLAQEYQKIIIVNTKPQNAFYFKNITLLILNQKEAFLVAKTDDLKKAGDIIQEELNCNILITQGAEGMTLFVNDKIKHFPAETKKVFDVTGAGDTVTAAFSLALVYGADFEAAAVISNQAAGIVVGKKGTAVVCLKELINALKNNYE